MPFLTPATFRRLREAAAGRDGAVLVDPDGRRQLALVAGPGPARRGPPDHEAQHEMALHRLLETLDLADVPAEGRSTATSTPGPTSGTSADRDGVRRRDMAALACRADAGEVLEP